MWNEPKLRNLATCVQRKRSRSDFLGCHQKLKSCSPGLWDLSQPHQVSLSLSLFLCLSFLLPSTSIILFCNSDILTPSMLNIRVLFASFCHDALVLNRTSISLLKIMTSWKLQASRKLYELRWRFEEPGLGSSGSLQSKRPWVQSRLLPNVLVSLFR